MLPYIDDNHGPKCSSLLKRLRRVRRILPRTVLRWRGPSPKRPRGIISDGLAERNRKSTAREDGAELSGSVCFCSSTLHLPAEAQEDFLLSLPSEVYYSFLFPFPLLVFLIAQ